MTFRLLMYATAIAAMGVAGNAQRPPTLVPLDATGLITYYLAEGIPTFGSRPGDNELATWAFDEWERASGGAIRLERIPEEAPALIRLYWMAWRPSEYGQMTPHVANRRRAALVFVRPNTHLMHKMLGPAAESDPLLRDTIVYLTCLHEIGHALGLGHTTAENDVMRAEGFAPNFERYRQKLSTRADIAKVAWLSEVDTLRIRGLYQR